MLLIQIDSLLKALSVEGNTDLTTRTKKKNGEKPIGHFYVNKIFLWGMFLHCLAVHQHTGASI